MELYEHRVINGLLRELDTVADPDSAQALLAIDCEIVVPPERADGDLWPCLWALASVLERQFSGTIYMNCGLLGAPKSPARLGRRCVFGLAPSKAMRISVGLVGSRIADLQGDARGSSICVGPTGNLASDALAHPAAGFALAGYLGFAALALATDIPPHRQDFAQSSLLLPILSGDVVHPVPDLSIVGLGHLGQAYLALLFFLADRSRSRPCLALLDKDAFSVENYATQILLEDGGDWRGVPKADYLESHIKQWGFEVTGEQRELTWSWRRPAPHPPTALLGLDDLDVRRMAVSAGYSWFLEAGLGSSFLWPRLTWHAMPADKRLANALFARREDTSLGLPDKPFIADLERTPARCGLLRFKSVQAAAPSMGLLAAALTCAELERLAAGTPDVVRGTATLWSPLLPIWRECLESDAGEGDKRGTDHARL
jgi:hypothetical protein